MASTYSTNLRIELQATGENRGSWGTKGNSGFNLLEEAIAGYEQVNMADANTTLTAVNGATDQARNMFLKLNGPNTATRTCTIPAVSKMYVVWNATGQTVNVTTGGAPTPPLVATYALLNGQSRMLWTDGSAIWSNDTLRSVSVSGSRWLATPYIDSAGTMEAGLNVDFHNTSGDTGDFAVRLGTNATTTDLYITPSGGAVRKVWNQGNDGSGSGMDADTVDGLHAADLIFDDAPSDGTIYGRQNAAWASTGSDVGSVVFFAKNSPPSGYLKANGASVLRTTYAALFAAIGTAFGAVDGTHFTLPDMRGEFPRGWDDSRGVDSGRVFGSFQGDLYENHSHTAVSAGSHNHTATAAGSHSHTGTTASGGSHTHTITAYGDNGPTNLSIRKVGDGKDPEATSSSDVSTHAGHTHTFTTDTEAAHTHTIDTEAAHTHTINASTTGGTETRPRNIALLACIKY